MSKLRDFFEDRWFDISEFFKNWIWPAYSLKNALFNRYDLVKLSFIKRTEYSDVVERMTQANFELVKFFIEKERPEEVVMWYQDHEGHDVGPRYGMSCDKSTKWDVMYPELQGEFVMDIIKDIYDYYVNRIKQQEHEDLVLSEFYHKWLADDMQFIDMPGCEASEVKFISKPKIESLDFFNEINVNWNVLDKYSDGDRKNLLDKDFVDKVRKDNEKKEFDELQKYLHLCIEMRPYMWT
jgi:hypothetical protein